MRPCMGSLVADHSGAAMCEPSARWARVAPENVVGAQVFEFPGVVGVRAIGAREVAKVSESRVRLD